MNFCDNQSRVGRQQWSICLNIEVRHRSISSQICVWQCRCERRQNGFQLPFFLKKNGGHTFFCMWQLSKYGKARCRNVTIKWTRGWCRKFCKDMTKKSCTGIKGMMFSTGVVRENLLKTAAFAQKREIITCDLIIKGKIKRIWKYVAKQQHIVNDIVDIYNILCFVNENIRIFPPSKYCKILAEIHFPLIFSQIVLSCGEVLHKSLENLRKNRGAMPYVWKKWCCCAAGQTWRTMYFFLFCAGFDLKEM